MLSKNIWLEISANLAFRETLTFYNGTKFRQLLQKDISDI